MKILVLAILTDVATATEGHVFLLEGIDAKEIDLVVVVNFISYNGCAIVFFVLYYSYR
jgi:hypothetical protein